MAGTHGFIRVEPHSRTTSGFESAMLLLDELSVQSNLTQKVGVVGY